MLSAPFATEREFADLRSLMPASTGMSLIVVPSRFMESIPALRAVLRYMPVLNSSPPRVAAPILPAMRIPELMSLYTALKSTALMFFSLTFLPSPFFSEKTS